MFRVTTALAVILLAGFLPAGGIGPGKAAAQEADSTLDQMAEQFLNDYFKAHPIFATCAGNHDYDVLLDDVSAAAAAQDITLCRAYLQKLEGLDPTALSPSKKLDRLIFREALEAILFEKETLKSHEWNPLYYSHLIDQAIDTLLSREFDSFFERVLLIVKRLEQLPAFLEQAKAVLDAPSKLHVELAIRQNEATLHLIKVNLRVAAEQSTHTVKKKMEKSLPKAEKALESYGVWLKNDLFPRAKRDFRLGVENYELSLKHILSSDQQAAVMQQAAETAMSTIHEEMFGLALPLYKEMKYLTDVEADSAEQKREIIDAVLDKISNVHPAKEDILRFAKTNIPKLESFLEQKKIAAVDPAQYLSFRETPEYIANGSVAFIDLPGPLEPTVKKYFNVDPIPAAWDKDKIESYLRENNEFALKLLYIRETYPGRVLQFDYRTKNPSLIRKIFANRASIEGWSNYCENMMIDQGYGYNDPRLKLVALKSRLKVQAAGLIDMGIHAAGMEKEIGLKILVDDGMIQPAQAEKLWQTACARPLEFAAPLIGLNAIESIRSDAEKSEKGGFNLKDFHSRVLEAGPIASQYLRMVIVPATSESPAGIKDEAETPVNP